MANDFLISFYTFRKSDISNVVFCFTVLVLQFLSHFRVPLGVALCICWNLYPSIVLVTGLKARKHIIFLFLRSNFFLANLVSLTQKKLYHHWVNFPQKKKNKLKINKPQGAVWNRNNSRLICSFYVTTSALLWAK